MKQIITRPAPWTFIFYNNPISCIQDVRDEVYSDEPAMGGLFFMNEPQVIDIYGDLQGHDNVQIKPGVTKIHYKLIR